MDKVWNGAGKPLGEDIRRLGREELIALALEVCEGAADCGAAFHGNIHPGNITRDAEGRSRLGPRADHAPGDWSTDELEYMAPELFWNGTADASADVYSIGLLLYAGVTGGLLPFFKRAPENMTNELRASALRRRMNGDEIHTPAAAGEKLGPVIEKCLKFEVSARYKDTRELAEALRPCVGEGDAKAMEMFGKPERELSEVERTMAGILAHLEPEEEEEPEPVKAQQVHGLRLLLLVPCRAPAQLRHVPAPAPLLLGKDLLQRGRGLAQTALAQAHHAHEKAQKDQNHQNVECDHSVTPSMVKIRRRGSSCASPAGT